MKKIADIIHELASKEYTYQNQLTTLVHDLNFLKSKKKELVLSHVSQYDMKIYLPYFPKYHNIEEVETTYECNRIHILNLSDPYTEEDDTEYMDKLECIRSNIKKKRVLIDILNKKLITIKAWFDCIEYVNGLQGPSIKGLIQTKIDEKYYTTNQNVCLYNQGKKAAFKALLEFF